MKKTILPLILSVGLSACGSFNSAPSGISGSVTRQAAVTPPNDGKGVLYIAALAQCDHAEKPLAVKVLADADLSSDMSGVPFQLPEINQSVYLAAFWMIMGMPISNSRSRAGAIWLMDQIAPTVS